jgi:DNA primase
MTKDEIKQTYSMEDIISRYGFKSDRAGFIRCPFHVGDKNASLKIYKDSFYCFGCGAGGDIFKFVMLMDGLSFKDAFAELGGTYERPATRTEERHRKRDLLVAKQNRQRQEDKRQREIIEMHSLGDFLSELVLLEKDLPPLSDEWCMVERELPEVYGKWLKLWEEVN